MSCMEPLAAMGLLCNILQLIEAGSQTYELIKLVYEGNEIDDSLKQKAIILGNVSDDIKPVNRPANRHEQQLVETAETCARAARQLREETMHIVGSASKGKLLSAVKAALTTLWRKRRLERLKNELDEAEKLMQTGLLVQIMSTINDTELDLTDLGGDIRSFIQEYRKGYRDKKRLVSRESRNTRTHVSTAIQSTNEAIERVGQDLGKLTFHVDVQVDQAKRERLLQSLKYPGFNERRNEVREAHPATFQWIFAGDDETSAGPGSRMSTIKWDSFSNWLKSTDMIYWISGKPGSGKSTLVKYILADPQIQATQQCLDVWSPGCLIISHYFWRPGNPMQRSIKGMLCSLLCQLLVKSETALAKVLASAPGSSMKGDATDWSLEELQSTLLTTMEDYHRPVCLFIDGLDEVFPEQPTTLVDMIKKISVAGKAKMCLASRPEPPLQRRLYNTPHLRLQDLTAADLTQYVHDHIPVSQFSMPSEYEAFVRLLVDQAEGVFLWLVLVTKSVRTGFDNGDTIEIIYERVYSLQRGDLESLYKDMWDRVAKDNPVTYRRTAAVYFRTMLFYGVNPVLRVYGNELSVFTLMLASTELAEKTLDTAPQTPLFVPEGTLLQGCKEIEKNAEIYCFGLLEVSERQGNDTNEELVSWYRGKYDTLLPYAQGCKTLIFTHRTAIDFLVGTAQGKDILRFDNTTEASHAFRLMAANLAHAQLFCDLNEYRFSLRGSLASTHLQGIDIVRKSYMDAGESATADITWSMTHCKRLCDFERVFAGVGFIQPDFVCSGVDFIRAVALYSWRCLDIFEHQIKTLGNETLSEVLHIVCGHFGVHHNASGDIEIFDGDFSRIIRLLLTAGADPNWDGTTAFANIQFTSGLTNIHHFRRTAFASFLSRIWQRAQGYNDHPPYLPRNWRSSNDLTKILATLQTFIRCGAHLDDLVAIVTHVAHPQPNSSESPETCQHLAHSHRWPWDTMRFGDSEGTEEIQYWYIYSVSAHNIINLVLSEWEPMPRLSDIEETLLADVKSSVAYSSGRHSRVNDPVLTRVEVINRASSLTKIGFYYLQWRWCAAPREHQEQIVKELTSLMTLSKKPVDIYQAGSSAATQALGYETLTSMLCGPHWIEKGSGSLESVFDYLVELRLFARYSCPREAHYIRDWLKLKGVEIADTTLKRTWVLSRNIPN